MYNQSDINGLAGGLAAAFAILWLVLIAVLVLEIVAKWKVYDKMGQAGWKSIIPFYSDFVLADTVHSRKMAIWYVALEVTLALLQPISSGYGATSSASTGPGMTLGALSFGVSIAVIVINIIVLNRLAKGFGHDTGFTVGLVLLGCVFLPILGFSKSERFDAGRLRDGGDDGTVPPASQQRQSQPQGRQA